MRRGEIWLGNLNPNRGAEVGKIRPVLIMQADFLIAQGEPTVVVLPLTTQVRASKEPFARDDSATGRPRAVLPGHDGATANARSTDDSSRDR